MNIERFNQTVMDTVIIVKHTDWMWKRFSFVTFQTFSNVIRSKFMQVHGLPDRTLSRPQSQHRATKTPHAVYTVFVYRGIL